MMYRGNLGKLDHMLAFDIRYTIIHDDVIWYHIF